VELGSELADDLGHVFERHLAHLAFVGGGLVFRGGDANGPCIEPVRLVVWKDDG
jgi:hypothetical protein